jgi:hypothetical protein
MLDILKKHLEEVDFECVVATWINGLKDEEQQAFALLMQNESKIVCSNLYSELAEQEKLPFKITAFRQHMRGYCSCRKN